MTQILFTVRNYLGRGYGERVYECINRDGFQLTYDIV